jgi:4-amino-4-deoxy-L-arabinose transferase-like glycosyltransferase
MVRVDKQVIIFFIGLLIFFAFNLNNRPFANPDESRYVEIPREMVASGDYTTPRLNGVKYFEKPPLLYWLQASSIKIFGLKEQAMRLWVSIFAFFGCLGTFFFTRKLFDKNIAFKASFILATSLLYYVISNLIILDIPVSVLLTFALYSFYLGFQENNLLKRRLYFYGFASFCALGILTKGIMILALTAPIIFLWLTFSKNWCNFKKIYFFTSFGILLLIAVPWHVLVSLKNPDFLYKYFYVEHWLRYTSKIHLRYQPFWFFFPILILGFLPWSVALFDTIKKAWHDRKDEKTLFLLIWFIWILVFFSCSGSKLVPYIIPAFPPLAILIAKYWQYVDEKNRFFFLIFTILFILSGIYVYKFYYPQEQHLISLAIILASIFLLLFCFYKKKFSVHIAALVLCMVANLYFERIQKPSIKKFAQYINKIKKDDQILVSYKSYFQDLPVYTQQIITIVDVGGELDFGIKAEDTKKWVWDEKTFLDSLGKKNMLIIAKLGEFNNLVKKTNILFDVMMLNRDFVLFRSVK